MTSEQIVIEITNHDDRIKVCEKGVSNFRDFQSEMRGKLGFVYGATWAAGISGAIFLILFTWALNQIVPAARLVIDDYYHNHPASKLQQKTVVTPPMDPYTARINTPQVVER